LVSVRNAEEALAALAGGADVIDVKEPARGPLGAADLATIADVVRVVAGRAPVTAAAGELSEFNTAGPFRSGDFALSKLDGVALVKLGLASCADRVDWPADLRRAMGSLPGDVMFAAVVYADWQLANSPQPDTILAAAVELGCPAVLVDTWNKSGGSLLDQWSREAIRTFVERAHAAGQFVALAGSLSLEDVREAADFGSDLIAVRGAASEGGREGVVSQRLVSALREQMDRVASAVV
jgi:uncharacterized protein (UPF0264 family)